MRVRVLNRPVASFARKKKKKTTTTAQLILFSIFNHLTCRPTSGFFRRSAPTPLFDDALSTTIEKTCWSAAAEASAAAARTTAEKLRGLFGGAGADIVRCCFFFLFFRLLRRRQSKKKKKSVFFFSSSRFHFSSTSTSFSFSFFSTTAIRDDMASNASAGAAAGGTRLERLLALIESELRPELPRRGDKTPRVYSHARKQWSPF